MAGVVLCSCCCKSLVSALKCSACKRKSYCSKECQRNDWPAHKTWCLLRSGEMNQDWEIVHISDDFGLGVVAKRDFEIYDRIMIDRMITEPEFVSGNHNLNPEFVSGVMPHDSSLYDKFHLNCLSCDENGPGYSPFISKVNHNCNPNAYHHFDENGSKTKILSASKPIKKGEEIFISYINIFNPHCDMISPELLQVKRDVLAVKYNIQCDTDCVCKSDELQNQIQVLRQLDADIMSADVSYSFSCAKQLIEAATSNETNSAIWFDLKRIYYDAFQVGILTRKNVNEALQFMVLLNRLEICRWGPQFPRNREIPSSKIHPEQTEMQRIADHPNSHPNYRAVN